ncbi:MAG: RhoGEF domain-containing protein [Candidatus Berkiella sp.]
MFSFNNQLFENALIESGLGEKSPCYKELINSEINYINHFLNYLDDNDIENLLKVYDDKKFKMKQKELSKDSLRYLYNALKGIYKKQGEVLLALYQADPNLWFKAINNLYDVYVHYISTRQGLQIPAKLEEKFKEIQAQKLELGHPEVGSLDAVFVAPIQRLPRYALLGRELYKIAALKLQEAPSEALITFKTALETFNESVLALTQRVNQSLQSPLTSDDLIRFLKQPPATQVEKDDEPTSPYLMPSTRLKPKQVKIRNRTQEMHPLRLSKKARK